MITAPAERVLLGAVLAVMVVVGTVAVVVVRGGGDGGAPPGSGEPTSITASSPSPGSTSAGSGTTGSPVPTGPPAPTGPPGGPTTPSTGAPPTTGTPAPAVAVRRGDPNRPVVALTFDAGSDTGSAAAILDRLRAEGIRATFGMTGHWAEDNPALVRRMAAEGHLLVNHSYDHPSFTGRSTGAAALSTAERLDQLARAEAAVRAAAGVGMAPWFRPPYGDEDASVRADVARAGYRWELLWTVDSLGWKGIPAAEVTARCLDGAVPGAVFLLHVGAASTDAEALPAVIAGLRARGYGFVTAADLVP